MALICCRKGRFVKSSVFPSHRIVSCCVKATVRNGMISSSRSSLYTHHPIIQVSDQARKRKAKKEKSLDPRFRSVNSHSSNMRIFPIHMIRYDRQLYQMSSYRLSTYPISRSSKVDCFPRNREKEMNELTFHLEFQQFRWSKT